MLDHARRRQITTLLTPFVPYERHVWTALEDILQHDRYERLHSLTMGWLVRGHAHRVGELLSTVGEQDGLLLSRFFDRGIRDFMAQVGSAWLEGRLRVGEEHLVTQIVIEAIHRIKARLVGRGEARPPSRWRPPLRGETKPRRPAPAAVVGTMQGDFHHVGALCVGVLLEQAGWEVAYLGADVPVDEFAAMQRNRDARLVCVSFAPPRAGADVERCTTILREFYRADHPYALALGGGAIEEGALRGEPDPFLAVGVFGGCEGFLDWLPGAIARAG